jgi:hypothetical protein
MPRERDAAQRWLSFRRSQREYQADACEDFAATDVVKVG